MEFNQWTMITVAIVFGCTIPLAGIWMSYKEKKLKLSGAGEAARKELAETQAALEQANARIDEMGERIKVLERLATDGDAQLARSFETLKREAEAPAG